jgi:hypothetical protein
MALDARVLALEQKLDALRQGHELSLLSQQCTHSRELQSLHAMISALQEQVSTLASTVSRLEAITARQNIQARQFSLGADCLDGIVSHLSCECGGNVDDLDVVAVASSDPQSDSPSFAGLTQHIVLCGVEVW